MELGTVPTYRPLWSDAVEKELTSVIQKRHRARNRDEEETEAYIKRLLGNMNAALPDAQVSRWESIVHQIKDGPDPNDTHIIAAAVLGHADVIVTFNLKDFPTSNLPGHLFSQSPDAFLQDLFGLYPRQVVAALNQIASRTGHKGPKLTVEDILTRLAKGGVPEFAEDVREQIRRQTCQ